MHPHCLLTNVGSELYLPNISKNCRYIRLVELGYYFTCHLKISETDKKVYMAIQLIGTKLSAKKWLYEIHVYNKSEKHRKYFYTDNCRSSIDNMEDVFKAGECAVLPAKYASTFDNNEEVTFKIFIRRTREREAGRRGSDRVWHRRGKTEYFFFIIVMMTKKRSFVRNEKYFTDIFFFFYITKNLQRNTYC